MTIAKRITTGWTKQQANKDKYKCDDCNQRLWVAPDGKTLYCNELSNKHKEQSNE